MLVTDRSGLWMRRETVAVKPEAEMAVSINYPGLV